VLDGLDVILKLWSTTRRTGVDSTEEHKGATVVGV
jgi:hypothetical protein